MGLPADFAAFDHRGARGAGGCAGGRHACRADGGDGRLRGRRYRGIPHARLRRPAAVSAGTSRTKKIRRLSACLCLSLSPIRSNRYLLVLGHVALALARVSRLKLKRFPLIGRLSVTCVDRCNQIVFTPRRMGRYEFFLDSLDCPSSRRVCVFSFNCLLLSLYPPSLSRSGSRGRRAIRLGHAAFLATRPTIVCAWDILLFSRPSIVRGPSRACRPHGRLAQSNGGHSGHGSEQPVHYCEHRRQYGGC